MTSYPFFLTHSIRIEVIGCLPEMKVALSEAGGDVNFGSCGHEKVTNPVSHQSVDSAAPRNCPAQSPSSDALCHASLIGNNPVKE
jgi:hypothetical protein